MNEERNELRVGSSSMFAKTLPVFIIVDQVFNSKVDEDSYTRLQLLQIDDLWLVITENCFEGEFDQKFTCFEKRSEAFKYFSLMGFKEEETPYY